MSATPSIPAIGTFGRGKKTATAGTAITQLIEPYHGKTTGLGTGTKGEGIIHIAHLCYDVSTTAHTLTIFRPLNYTTFSADAAAAQAVVNITADPGVYSTNFKYPLPNGQTAPSTADNAIAANDYVVYQTAAGQYVLDTVSSVSTLAITLTTNLPTGGVKAGGLFWFYGITTDTDPTTNLAHIQMTALAAASGTSRYDLSDATNLWNALHPGDPMFIYSDNSTAAGTIQLVAGWHGKL